jgi:excisionase family DNA binding protein
VNTVEKIADRYGVGVHTVLAWIRNRELQAINVGRTAGRKRPSWRISDEALAAFEAARSASPTPPPTRRPRRPKAVGVIEFYPAGASG